MDGAFVGAVMDLVAAREAGRRGSAAGRRAGPHGGEEALLADGHAEVVMGVAERAGHAAAAGVEHVDLVTHPAQDRGAGGGPEDGFLLTVTVELQRAAGL